MASSTRNRRGGGANKGGGRRNENNRIYAYSLPMLFEEPQGSVSKTIYNVTGILGASRLRLLKPQCEGVFDAATRSVWVTNPSDVSILWKRGFFGKGDLSRSEPSWHARQINARRMAGKQLTSEEIREKRRAERKQFKLDRAKALADAAAEAEAAFTEGREAVAPIIPSGATWKPQVIPAANQEDVPSSTVEVDEALPEPEEELEDVEHLQLTMAEAFFLCWALDCLTILDSITLQPMGLKDVWQAFQGVQMVSIPKSLTSPDTPYRFDNPFLVNYAVYHYYRSLGWVVKSGIKFCVDLLLYKRGPVFHHAEFGVVVIPVYENPQDKETSPYKLTNVEPFTWTWLSTINRVNSQVQKTLVLTYVTIPSESRHSTPLLSSPACLAQYSVREVVLRRFIPARMRD